MFYFVSQALVGFGGIYLKWMYKGERNLTGYNEIKHKVRIR
jgi:hypothetical protein